MGTADLEPWQWEEATWRRHAEAVRAGRSLAPRAWPGGAKVAVALSFDADHETPALRDGKTSPGLLSQGAYGARAGVPRILELLAARGIPATFFVPAVSALLHPDDVREYADRGHEVAMHGWIHESNLSLPASAERDLAFRAADTLERLAGRRPVGIRTPSWDFSPHTLSVIRGLGLSYDSSLMADDDPYELLDRGEPTGIVEVPVDWIRDDAPYFGRGPGASIRPYATPRAAAEVWRDEFIGAYDGGGLFQITLHPHIIGHRSRLAALSELLDEISSRGQVWYATHEQVAQHVMAHEPPA